MAQKFIFSGYELAQAAYVGLVLRKVLPQAPEGKQYNWKFSLPDPNEYRSCELMFVLEDKDKPEPEKPYEAGDWMKDESS